MSREIIEFSDLIDEQFEPVAASTADFWPAVMHWFANPAPKANASDHLSETVIDQLGEIKIA
ncbi:hypothetical protein [Mucilaginibacter sp. CSA2-8R]|uniref:hypothetical protein n=1 Tax=Mucilaginibacter sp. CSA2-8R TaxID=3141542 RepID=UPI00315CA075